MSMKTVYFYSCEGRKTIENKDIPRFELAAEEVAVHVKSLENDTCSSGSHELTARVSTPCWDWPERTAGDDRRWTAKNCDPRCWSES